MDKIGIVILNYLSYWDTEECVDSILTQSYENFKIAIVDNYSENDSYEILCEKYRENVNVSVVRTDSNIGFARGNNVGIEMLKKEGYFDVLVINGDTILTDKDYLRNLANLDIPLDCAMIGTTVINANGKNQNTEKVKIKTRADIFRVFVVLCFSWVFNFFYIKKFILFLKRRRMEKTTYDIDEINSEEKIPKLNSLNPDEEMLHGSAILFTENYLKRYVGFFPDTFLYMEEDILAIICAKIGFHQGYCPALSIYHKEESSTNFESNYNARRKQLKKIKFLFQDLWQVLNILNWKENDLKNILLDDL